VASAASLPCARSSSAQKSVRRGPSHTSKSFQVARRERRTGGAVWALSSQDLAPRRAGPFLVVQGLRSACFERPQHTPRPHWHCRFGEGAHVNWNTQPSRDRNLTRTIIPRWRSASSFAQKLWPLGNSGRGLDARICRPWIYVDCRTCRTCSFGIADEPPQCLSYPYAMFIQSSAKCNKPCRRHMLRWLQLDGTLRPVCGIDSSSPASALKLPSNRKTTPRVGSAATRELFVRPDQLSAARPACLFNGNFGS
jgi:hypothetical protein